MILVIQGDDISGVGIKALKRILIELSNKEKKNNFIGGKKFVRVGSQRKGPLVPKRTMDLVGQTLIKEN